MKKLLLILCVVGVQVAQAQRIPANIANRAGEVQFNTIYTAVPFLMIGPDSRSGAMGDAGVALSPDANSMHWNPAKLAFAPNTTELAINYNPWMRALVPDMNVAYLSGYLKRDAKSALGGSLRYFSLGKIQFTDETGNNTIQVTPKELALDAAYSMKFSDQMSGAVSLRFIQSNLFGQATSATGGGGKPGRALAGDISMYYVNDNLKISGTDATLSYGLNISNIGTKIQYSDAQVANFLPTNLRTGVGLKLDMDDYNDVTFHLELNKLLVPTPPVIEYDENGEEVIVAGRNPDVSVASGMFGSFTDAPGEVILDDDGNFVGVTPGSVTKEELREVNIALGTEYWYMNQFAMRAGFFYEHQTKGNRKYVTMGGGLKYTSFDFNLSYLISLTQNNPLANSWRFSMIFNLDFTNANPDESKIGQE